ncbi:MAG: hypothetical protein PHW53_04630 [Patescibacteria group bacterium]|nr:hypothetical protein [Patescibacteria group bacterium]
MPKTYRPVIAGLFYFIFLNNVLGKVVESIPYADYKQGQHNPQGPMGRHENQERQAHNNKPVPEVMDFPE